jgi:very-short-patch-repair endonuclease
MSLPEVLLWRELRQKPAGHQFRRQHPAGSYVLDFFCATANLAVEVDGELHAHGGRPARDQRRDEWLRGQDVRVLRVPAIEVLRNLEGVLRAIAAELEQAPPPPRPAGAVPLPRSCTARKE